MGRVMLLHDTMKNFLILFHLFHVDESILRFDSIQKQAVSDSKGTKLSIILHVFPSQEMFLSLTVEWTTLFNDRLT